MPCFSAAALICAATPCASTTRMLRERNTATSKRMFGKFSSVTMSPSAAITKVFSRNCGTYWRIPRRSVNFTCTPDGLNYGRTASFHLKAVPLYTLTENLSFSSDSFLEMLVEEMRGLAQTSFSEVCDLAKRDAWGRWPIHSQGSLLRRSQTSKVRGLRQPGGEYAPAAVLVLW